MIALALVGAAVLLLGLYVVVAYNRFVSQRAYIDSAWSGIDVELTRRADLIPNLVSAVKGYAAHEASVLAAVTEARAAAVARRADPPAERALLEDALGQALTRMQAVAEAYPELQASTNFLQLQTELRNTEDRIANHRRLYNANVRAYNERVRSVPSNFVAAAFSFEAREFFDAAPAAHVVPSVAF